MEVKQFSFNGGQINRGLIGRKDLAKFYSSAFHIENFIVKRHGTLSKRNGFEIAETLDYKPVRMIPFVKDNETCDYVVFSSGAITVYHSDGRAAERVATTWTDENALREMTYVQSGDMLFLASRKYPPAQLQRSAEGYTFGKVTFEKMRLTNTPTLTMTEDKWKKADSSQKRTLLYRATEVVDGKEVSISNTVEVESYFPPAVGSIRKFSITSPAGGVEGYNLYRNDGSGWGFIGSTVDGELAADEEEKDNLLMLIEAERNENGNFVATIPTSNVAREFTSFETLPDGYTMATNFPFAVAANATETVTITTSDTEAETLAVKLWYTRGAGAVTDKNAFVDDYISLDHSRSIPIYRQPFKSDGDYPGVVSLYQQRLVWASTENEPSMFWMSVAGDLKNMSVHVTLQEDDAINNALPLTRGPRILHAVPHKYLLFFCQNAECVIMPRGDGGLSYKTIDAQTPSYTGSSASVVPIVCGNAVLFCDRAESSVREYKYDYTQDTMAGTDKSVLNCDAIAEHGGIKDWTYQMFPDSVVWCVMNDGTLAMFTYMPEQEVYAWSCATLPDGYKAVAISCGDALVESDTEIDTRYKFSHVALLVEKDGVQHFCTMTNGFTDFGDVPIAGTVEMVPPDNQGQLEGRRRRIVAVDVRTKHGEGVNVTTTGEEGEHFSDAIDHVIAPAEGPFKHGKLCGHYDYDSRVKITDDGIHGRRTEIRSVVVGFECVDRGM